MRQSEKKSSLLRQKLVFTSVIVLVYIMGRCIPLYGVDFSAYAGRKADVQALLVQTISGDVNRCSLFALGISPYMMGSILVQMFLACRKIWSKAKVSPKRTNRAILTLTLLLAALQAFFQAQSLLLNVLGDGDRSHADRLADRLEQTVRFRKTEHSDLCEYSGWNGVDAERT